MEPASIDRQKAQTNCLFAGAVLMEHLDAHLTPSLLVLSVHVNELTHGNPDISFQC